MEREISKQSIMQNEEIKITTNMKFVFFLFRSVVLHVASADPHLEAHAHVE